MRKVRINPYFANAAAILSIENNEFTSSASSLNADMFLSPGWNKLVYAFIGKGINYKDSLRIFYSKNKPFLFKDDFNDGIMDKGWIVVMNEPKKNPYMKEENGSLFLKGPCLIQCPVFKVDPRRKLIIEVKSLSKGHTCYYANDVLVNINSRFGFICRQDCNMEEHGKVVLDLITGIVECFVNGVMIKTY